MNSRHASKPVIEALGERAWLIHFETETLAFVYANLIRDQGHEAVEDVVSAYLTVAVILSQRSTRTEVEELEKWIQTRLEEFTKSPIEAGPISESIIEIPVIYDGPDLQDVAKFANLTPEEVVAWHSSLDYHVFAVGFLPGFPYCGYLPEVLAGIPRRSEPRMQVPSGSVAIAGRQTGIYPCQSPGGWHLLGRTDLQIADPENAFFRFQAGNSIRFIPQSGGVLPSQVTLKNSPVL